VSRLADSPRLSTGDLARDLHRASGFPRLRQALDEAFRWRADVIKAGNALAALDRVASAAAPHDREALRDAVEDLVARPEYHRLPLLAAAEVVSTGEVPLPEPMERELTRLALSDDPGFVLDLPGAAPGELGAAARAAAVRWRAFAVADATPAQSRVALVAHRGFHLLSQSLLASPAGQPGHGAGVAP
jgi:hypothetical protein